MELKEKPMGEKSGEPTPPPGLLIKAHERVVIKALDSKLPRPTFLLRYLGATARPWSALTIDCPQSLTEGIRVEINAGGAGVLATPNAVPPSFTGLTFKGGKEHEIRDCEVLQTQPGPDAQMAGVILDPPAGEAQKSPRPASVLKLASCVFLGSSVSRNPDSPEQGLWPRRCAAVVRRWPIGLEARNCAFGPHASVFVLEKGDSGLEKGEPHRPAPLVLLNHCSILAGPQSAIFELEDKASAAIDVSQSLVSLLEGERSEGPVLVQQKGDPGKATYKGTDNRYHNLKAFWSTHENEQDIALTDFAGQLKKTNRGQDSSVEVERSPWKDPEPLRRLEEQRFRDAFEVNGQQSALRLSKDSDHAVGSERLLGKFYDRLEALPSKDILVVDPKRNDSANGVYQSLSQALQALNRPSGERQGSDVILIRHNGELLIEQLRLEKKEIDVVLKPDKGFRPILVLGEARQQETALFWLHEGKLRLEGLEVRLQPVRDYQTQTILSFLGDGTCTFKDCLITLVQQPDNPTALSVCTIQDTEGAMRMMPTTPSGPGQGPRLEMEGCIVRGDGDLLVNKSNRPFEVVLSKSLAALKGTLLALKPPARGSANVPGQMTFRMEQVTSYLDGHLLNWTVAGDSPRVTLPNWMASNCVFLPATPNQDLIRLDLPEADLATVREGLRMSGPNACGYKYQWDRPAPSESTRVELAIKAWEAFTGDRRSRVDVTLAAPPTDVPYSRMTPSQFKLKEVEGFGADLNVLQKMLSAE